MLPPEVPPRKPGTTARLQHQAFFEALQHGEGTRDWTASRAGLIVLRYVLARSDMEWEPGALAAEEGRVSAAVEALPADDPERATLQAILHAVAAAFRSTTPLPAEPDAKRAPHPAEAVAEALIAYGDVLLARSAWPLAADVYATVWDTRAAPDTRFGGGVDPRDAEEAPEDRDARNGRMPPPPRSGISRRQVHSPPSDSRSATGCWDARQDAADALVAAKAAAAQCRNAAIGEYVGFRARLGETLLLLDAGLSPAGGPGARRCWSPRALATLASETSTPGRATPRQSRPTAANSGSR